MLPANSIVDEEVLEVCVWRGLCWEVEEKGRWGKWCKFLAYYEIVGGELILDDQAHIELLVHVGYSIVALGTCSHWGDLSGKQIYWPSVVLYCVQEIVSLHLMGKQLLVSMTHLQRMDHLQVDASLGSINFIVILIPRFKNEMSTCSISVCIAKTNAENFPLLSLTTRAFSL